MIDKKSLLALFEEGKSADDIAKDFSDALNAAEKEHKAKVEAAQKAEALMKVKDDFADDIAALLTKYCDTMDLGFTGKDIMDFAKSVIKGFTEEFKKACDPDGFMTPPDHRRRCNCDPDGYIMPENADHRKQRGRTAPNSVAAWDDKNYFDKKVQDYKDAGWTVDEAEHKSTENGFFSKFKAHK